MSLFTVDKTKCKKDGVCIESCPVGCLTADAEGYPADARAELCFGCGHCVAICPHGALGNAKLPAQAFLPVPDVRIDPEAVEVLMKSRRSVREFKNKPLTRPELEKLLDIARFAPTARHTQLVSWVVTTDPAKTKTLAGACADWLRQTKYLPGFVEAWDKGEDVILRGAPHAVVALTPKEWDWGAVDATIALTYMELAAASLGFGVCWAGLLTRAAGTDAAVASALGVPEGFTVQGALMLGRPKYRYNLIPPRNEAKVSWI